LEKCWEQNTDIHQLFIDFQAACNTVRRKEIWNEMHKLDSPPLPKFKLCRILNNILHIKVKIGKHLSSVFKVNKWLRQGDIIAPLLFNIMLEIATRRAKLETRGNILDKCSQIMAYSDDMVLMGRRVKDVGEVFTSLVE